MQDTTKEITKIKYFPKLPYLSQERSQKFSYIVLTLLALSFFGFFAISPTVSTILKLKKEVTDSEFVYRELETKIKNLSILGQRYASLQNDLPSITDAITREPNVHLLFAQIQGAAQKSNIKLSKLQNFEVEILKNNNTTGRKYYSYPFTIAGKSSFENISDFVSTITDMQRIINIDIFSISSTIEPNSPLEFNIQGTAFFKD